MTGAMKYMLMKNFLISTGDDPELYNSRSGQAKSAPRKPTEKPVAKLPPTKAKVLETLANQMALPPLQLAYDKVFGYAWSSEDTREITECFLNCYANLAALEA